MACYSTPHRRALSYRVHLLEVVLKSDEKVVHIYRLLVRDAKGLSADLALVAWRLSFFGEELLRTSDFDHSATKPLSVHLDFRGNRDEQILCGGPNWHPIQFSARSAASQAHLLRKEMSIRHVLHVHIVDRSLRSQHLNGCLIHTLLGWEVVLSQNTCPSEQASGFREGTDQPSIKHSCTLLSHTTNTHS